MTSQPASMSTRARRLIAEKSFFIVPSSLQSVGLQSTTEVSCLQTLEVCDQPLHGPGCPATRQHGPSGVGCPHTGSFAMIRLQSTVDQQKDSTQKCAHERDCRGPTRQRRPTLVYLGSPCYVCLLQRFRRSDDSLLTGLEPVGQTLDIRGHDPDLRDQFGDGPVDLVKAILGTVQSRVRLPGPLTSLEGVMSGLRLPRSRTHHLITFTRAPQAQQLNTKSPRT